MSVSFFKKTFAAFLAIFYLFSIFSGLNLTAFALGNDNADLADLTIDGVTVQGFNKNNLSYDISVDFTCTQVLISAQAEDTNAVVSGDTSSQDIVAGLNTFTVTVTAEDSIVTKTYTLNVTKEESSSPTPAPEPTPSPTPSTSLTPEPTASDTLSPSDIPSPEPTPNSTITPSPAPTATSTPIPSGTIEPIVSPESTPENSPVPREIITTADGIVFDTETWHAPRELYQLQS